MKFYISIAVIVWLLSGIAGAMMLGHQSAHWPTIAGGPVTLVKAFNEPVD